MRSERLCGVRGDDATVAAGSGAESLHIILWSADAVQHGDQLVGRSETAGLEHRRRRHDERLKLLCWIRAQIDFRALKAGMAEPEGDLSDVPRRLERMHCAGVAEDMRAHPFVGDGKLLAGRRRHMLGEDVLEPRSGHGMADTVEEQLRIATQRSAGEPSLQRGGRLLPQWQYAFAPPLPQHMDAGDRRKVELIQSKADEFRDAQSGRKGEMEHGSVANARSSARIRRIKQRLQLLPRKVSDKRLVSKDQNHNSTSIQI